MSEQQTKTDFHVALVAAAKRVLTWVEPIAGDNIMDPAAEEETASVQELQAAIALAESGAAMSHNELLRLVRAFRDECIRQEIKFGPLIADADAALSQAKEQQP